MSASPEANENNAEEREEPEEPEAETEKREDKTKHRLFYLKSPRERNGRRRRLRQPLRRGV